jgi:hypothetical protein
MRFNMQASSRKITPMELIIDMIKLIVIASKLDTVQDRFFSRDITPYVLHAAILIEWIDTRERCSPDFVKNIISQIRTTINTKRLKSVRAHWEYFYRSLGDSFRIEKRGPIGAPSGYFKSQKHSSVKECGRAGRKRSREHKGCYASTAKLLLSLPVCLLYYSRIRRPSLPLNGISYSAKAEWNGFIYDSLSFLLSLPLQTI